MRVGGVPYSQSSHRSEAGICEIPYEQCPTLRNGFYMWGSLCALSPEVRKTARVVVQKDLRSEGILTGWGYREQNVKNVR